MGVLALRAMAVLLFAVVSVVVASPAVVNLDPAQAEQASTTSDVKMVSPDPDSRARIWPYTSKRQGFDARTLPINFVVRDDVETTRFVLTHQPGTRWRNETTNATNGTLVSNISNATNRTLGIDIARDGPWRQTHGGTRYTYVVNEDDEGRWIEATHQLHDGDYFGTRHHLRLYEGGQGEHAWTAIQAHEEHWDWFALRHDVGSLSTAQHGIEREFYGKWYVSDISRKRFANGGTRDADGWVSVVDLRDFLVVPPNVLVLPLLGAALTTRLAIALGVGRDRLDGLVETNRITADHAVLLAVVSVLPLLVRVGSITVERAHPELSPLLIGGPFYLLLVLGLPACAAAFSRRLPPSEAFVVAAIAFGTGVMLDYAYLQITILQYGVVLHRLAAAAALGLVAAGSARARSSGRRRLATAGLVAWALVVLGPPLGVV